MNKKYFPYIALLAALLLFLWVKKKQRGTKKVNTTEIQSEPVNRSAKNIRYSKHARCRMECRQIDESEVKEILQKGEINFGRVEEDEKGKTYPFEGITHDKQHVRIVFAPHDDAVVVVTVIDLGKEHECPEC